jgi:hypothetical protein
MKPSRLLKAGLKKKKPNDQTVETNSITTFSILPGVLYTYGYNDLSPDRDET